MSRNAARMMAFVAGVIMVAGLGGVLTAEEKKAPSVKQIMKAMNGPKGFVGAAVAAGQAGEWDKAAELGVKAAKCSAFLAKNEPKKGDASSWETFAKKYAEVGAEVEAAAKAKDLEKLEATNKTFKGACGACHKSHK